MPHPPQHPRLLIAEDNPMLLRTLTRGMTSQGFEVTAASNAQSAIVQLTVMEFDAVICDGLHTAWRRVAEVAAIEGVAFMLYSGDADRVARAIEDDGITGIVKGSPNEFANLVAFVRGAADNNNEDTTND
jgi:CheY-like chemotaxis protein